MKRINQETCALYACSIHTSIAMNKMTIEKEKHVLFMQADFAIVYSIVHDLIKLRVEHKCLILFYL